MVEDNYQMGPQVKCSLSEPSKNSYIWKKKTRQHVKKYQKKGGKYLAGFQQWWNFIICWRSICFHWDASCRHFEENVAFWPANKQWIKIPTEFLRRQTPQSVPNGRFILTPGYFFGNDVTAFIIYRCLKYWMLPIFGEYLLYIWGCRHGNIGLDSRVLSWWNNSV